LDSPLRYRLLLVATAILFSTGGAAIKAATLSGWQVASFRSLVAATVLMALLPDARRGWSWRMLPVSTAYAATLILFVLANRLTTSANAIFLQSTAPIYVLLAGPVLLHERIRRADVVYMLAVAAGLSLFFVGRERISTTAPDPAAGNLLALGSGVAYAAMLVGMRWLARQRSGPSGIATVAVGNLIAFGVALPMALPVHALSPASAMAILYLGAVQIGLAYCCLTSAIRHVTAFEAMAMLQLEPALNPVWTWLAHGERPGAWAIAGGAIIVSATLVNTWWNRPDTA
jgi:drug/metabolite transporter, DME family